MTADSIDYAELNIGQRSEGIITSTRTFITKLATAVAGAAAAYALDLIGYVPNAEQAKSVNDSFHSLMSLYPAILYGIGLVVLIFYPLGKAQFAEMEKKLAEKRAAQ